MSKFEDYLDLVVYQNKSGITKDDDIIDYPDLEQDQLSELCCLYAIEDKSHYDKDEVLGLNYTDNAAELVEWVARLCSNEYYGDPDERQAYLENINKIATAAIVNFYENNIIRLYGNRMHALMQDASFEDPEEE
jgi:hypothetical protein